ncbi:MAG: TerB family tellurite resistance protein [Hyphomicrobiales bacterium]
MKLFFDKFSDLFHHAEFEEDNEKELRRAISVLIVHACAIDGKVTEREELRRDSILKERFGLSADEVRDVVKDAELQDQQAIDLYKFTHVIAKQLDQTGRKDVIRMLWEVVLADGKIDEFESNLVWRLSELLGVSTRDRVNLRQQVQELLNVEGNGNG